MKRTTLILAPEIDAALRSRAARAGRTLTEVVEQTLRAGLLAPARRKRFRLPSYDLGPFLAPLPGAPGPRRAPPAGEG
ncbi:MAG: hypothetical protein ABIS67_11170 [Candidatus Eisenbacteria bacterium]